MTIAKSLSFSNVLDPVKEEMKLILDSGVKCLPYKKENPLALGPRFDTFATKLMVLNNAKTVS